MKIIELQDKNNWNQWLQKNCNYSNFTQSWDWGEVLMSENKEVNRLGVELDKQIVAQASVTTATFPLGIKYGFIPKGPIFQKNDKLKIVKEYINYFKSKGYTFLRIEPDTILGFEKITRVTIDINPRTTVIIDVCRKEEELLKEMKAKTRYNIRLSLKKKIIVDEKKDLESFYNLSKETATRDEFSLHGKEHYQKILNHKNCLQLSAKLDDKVIASNFYFSFGNTLTYLFGASDYKSRKYMAPYLLQWQGIKKAKELGYKYYDLFGIAPKLGEEKNGKYNYDQNHQYAGVTRFKTGFGGIIKEDAGTYDLILDSKKYLLYKILRSLRRLL